MNCLVAGCGERAKTLDLCSGHYQRYRRGTLEPDFSVVASDAERVAIVADAHQRLVDLNEWRLRLIADQDDPEILSILTWISAELTAARRVIKELSS